MDPDVTTSPTRGIYVVYIMSKDKEKLALILGQGVWKLEEIYGPSGARTKLKLEGQRIRQELFKNSPQRFADEVDLRSSGSLQNSYVAGAICCKMYDLSKLPTASAMQADLNDFIEIYGRANSVKEEILLTEPGVLETPSTKKTSNEKNPLLHFKPKSSSEYITAISGKTIIKNRSHESLVKKFGEACAAHGFTPSTPHPHDLVLQRSDETILVEAKVVYQGDATTAVRGAVGQLLNYRYVWNLTDSKPKMLALFNEAIGDLYVEFLESLEIASIFWQSGLWVASPLAKQWELEDLN
jgi:hypothetical protein